MSITAKLERSAPFTKVLSLIASGAVGTDLPRTLAIVIALATHGIRNLLGPDIVTEALRLFMGSEEPDVRTLVAALDAQVPALEADIALLSPDHDPLAEWVVLQMGRVRAALTALSYAVELLEQVIAAPRRDFQMELALVITTAMGGCRVDTRVPDPASDERFFDLLLALYSLLKVGHVSLDTVDRIIRAFDATIGTGQPASV